MFASQGRRGLLSHPDLVVKSFYHPGVLLPLRPLLLGAKMAKVELASEPVPVGADPSPKPHIELFTVCAGSEIEREKVAGLDIPQHEGVDPAGAFLGLTVLHISSVIPIGAFRPGDGWTFPRTTPARFSASRKTTSKVRSVLPPESASGAVRALSAPPSHGFSRRAVCNGVQRPCQDVRRRLRHRRDLRQNCGQGSPVMGAGREREASHEG